MKKYSVFELIGIGIALLLICIIFSLIGKHVFDLEGDYLSAASTLFAAVIATLLYSDWKVQHRFTLLDKYHNELKKNISELFDEVFEISGKVRLVEGSTDKFVRELYIDLQKNLKSHNKRLNTTISLISEYQIFINNQEPTGLVVTHSNELKSQKKLVMENLLTLSSALGSNDINEFINTIYGGFSGINAKVLKNMLMIKTFSDVGLPEFYNLYFEEQ
ncbi:hypothetical protein ABTA53_12445 [Acinetobacter baumannii]|uniref:hypothetical protein n=1 Tax=Acinetobacter baumannii TaxID=470 RepID=UPI00112E8448|nr:hypothetical protein [Acinetobacter baumannii]EJB8480793.1 hypothetical protein [Acinetobacter baumannii]EKU3411456.1 hypothetical protein [Acinetobacter baumannii]MCZ2967107.1 hypothetical protein [Acinetobacter baumannii]MDA3476816.1 hypothetical protein [Acinetobacter baumannii]MDA3506270.1 hypothetical protein [Acinetobacter baumannii]